MIEPYNAVGLVPTFWGIRKRLSEICIIVPAAAIANAIYNAVGVRVRELPITPEKILAGLGKL